MEDFENLRGRCGGGCADAEAYSAKVSLNRNVDIVDGASSFTLMKKTVDIDRLRKSCTNRSVSLSGAEDLVCCGSGETDPPCFQEDQ